MPSIKELAWLAGIIEGEGYIGTSDMLIHVVMTDLDIIERVAQLFDAKILTKKKKEERYKTAYGTAVYGRDAAGWLMTLYPFFGERRKIAAKKALIKWRSSPIHKQANTFRSAICHPDRMYHAKGLCSNCYKVKEYYTTRKVIKPRIETYEQKVQAVTKL